MKVLRLENDCPDPYYKSVQMSDLVAKWRQYLEKHPSAANDVRIFFPDNDPESLVTEEPTPTPLYELVTGALPPGHPERIPLIQLLLEHGADPNARDPFGRTPLYYACYIDTRNECIVELLLQHGADPNVVDQFGCTPWSEVRDAAGDEADRIRKLLLEHGIRTDLNSLSNRDEAV